MTNAQAIQNILGEEFEEDSSKVCSCECGYCDCDDCDDDDTSFAELLMGEQKFSACIYSFFLREWDKYPASVAAKFGISEEAVLTAFKENPRTAEWIRQNKIFEDSLGAIREEGDDSWSAAAKVAGWVQDQMPDDRALVDELGRLINEEVEYWKNNEE